MEQVDDILISIAIQRKKNCLCIEGPDLDVVTFDVE